MAAGLRPRGSLLSVLASVFQTGRKSLCLLLRSLTGLQKNISVAGGDFQAGWDGAGEPGLQGCLGSLRLGLPLPALPTGVVATSPLPGRSKLHKMSTP